MVIYKISNTVNDKVYIGQSRGDGKKRWGQHQRSAFNPNSELCVSGKLYDAMRELGQKDENGENIWKFEILHSGITDLTNLNLLELQEIENHDSFRNGYNDTLGGAGTTRSCKAKIKVESKPKKLWCKYNLDGTFTGNCYKNQADAAESIGLKSQSKGWIGHSTKWQKGNGVWGDYGNLNGFLWLDIKPNEQPPQIITSYDELKQTERHQTQSTREFSPCSRQNPECKIAQYTMDGVLVKVWPNNVFQIEDETGITGISNSLNGNGNTAGGFWWKWYTNNDEIKNNINIIFSSLKDENGNKINTEIFQNEPVLKINPTTKKVVEYDSIQKIPNTSHINRFNIYFKAISKDNEPYNGYSWVFKKNFNDVPVNESIRRIKDLISKI
jgi:hypothetical protein